MNDISGIRRRVWINGVEVTNAISNQDAHSISRTGPDPETTSTITSEFTLLADRLGGDEAVDPILNPNLVGLFNLIETQVELPRGSGTYVDPPFGRRLRLQTYEPTLEGFVEDAFVVQKIRINAIDRMSYTRQPGGINDGSGITVGTGASVRDLVNSYLASIGLSLHVEPGDPDPSGIFMAPVVYQARGEATIDFLARLLSSNGDADGAMYGLWLDNQERIRIYQCSTTDVQSPWLNTTREIAFPGVLIPGARPSTGAKEQLPGAVIATSIVDVVATRPNPQPVTTTSRDPQNNQILARTVEQTTYGGGANGGDQTVKDERRIRRFAIDNFDIATDTNGDTLITYKNEVIDQQYNVLRQLITTTTTIQYPQANFIDGSTSETLEVAQVNEETATYTSGGSLLERHQKTSKAAGLLRKEFRGNLKIRALPLSDVALVTEQENIVRWEYTGADWVSTTNTYHYFIDEQFPGTTTTSGPGATPPTAQLRPSAFIRSQRQLDAQFVINYGGSVTITDPNNLIGTGTFTGTGTFSGTGAFNDGVNLTTGSQTFTGTGTFTGSGSFTGTGSFTGVQQLLRTTLENFENFPRDETALARSAQLSAAFKLGYYHAWDFQVRLEDAIAEHQPGLPVHMARNATNTFVFFAGDEVLDFEETRTLLGLKGLFTGQLINGVYEAGLNLTQVNTGVTDNILVTDDGTPIVTDAGGEILVV